MSEKDARIKELEAIIRIMQQNIKIAFPDTYKFLVGGC